MDWIYVLFVSVMLLFLLAFALSGRDILAPSVVMCAMFTLSTAAAIMGSERVGIAFGADSFAILFSGILTFILAEAFFRLIFQRGMTEKKRGRKDGDLEPASFGVPRIQGWIILAGIALDLFAIAWYVQNMIAVAGGIGGTYREVAVRNTITSWKTTLINPVCSQLLKLTTGMGYIAGFVLIQRLVAKKRDFSQIVGLLALMALGQAPLFLSGQRGGTLQFFTALIVYYYMLLHQKKGWRKNISWKFIRIGIICVLIGAPVFYYSLKLMGRKTMASLLEYFIGYVGYPIYSFDLYVKEPSPRVGFGEESLGGLLVFLSRFLGLDVHVRNANLEFRVANGMSMPNVYTFFRRPLHDFGYAGMLLFTILVALLFSWIYYSKIRWKPRCKGTDCWILAYGYLFYWIIVSSIVQYSQSYLSFGTLLTLLVIVVGYRLMTGIKLGHGEFLYHKKYWGSAAGAFGSATRAAR